MESNDDGESTTSICSVKRDNSVVAELRGESEDTHNDLYFTVNQMPPWTSILIFGFQQVMVAFNSLLVLPYIVSDVACAGRDTIQLRVQMIAATFVATGFATIVQCTFGLRLCILHGPSFAFIPALVSFAALPENKCNATIEDFVPQHVWEEKINIISGSLFCASIFLLLVGASGLYGVFCRFVGPVTVAPLLLLIGVGTVPTIEQKMSLHWISVVEYAILIFMAIYMENINIPFPYFSISERKLKLAWSRIFGLLPYLLGIGLAWLICYILTVTDLDPVGGNARTDNNMTTYVLKKSPWIQVPYPGQYGSPKFSLGLFLGFIGASICTLFESIGDYTMCARISQQRHPPSSSVNRAMMCEGFGCMIAGLLGVGAGVTTYAENIALMHITRVTSRVTMQMCGLLCIVIGCFTKIAALLATIPDAVVGGTLAMGMSVVAGVALSNLHTVDIRLSRNLSIMGVAIISGCVLPTYIGKNPINTNSQELNDVLNILLSTPMLIGGSLAFTLDNTVPGASRKQRGFPIEKKESCKDVVEDGYIFPALVNKFLLKFSFLCRIPFLPSERSLKEICKLQDEERENQKIKQLTSASRQSNEEDNIDKL